MNEIAFEGAPPVDSYFAGGFRIAGALHQGSALLLGGDVLHWTVAAPSQLDVSACRPILDRSEDFDVLIIGMGAEIAPLPAHVRRAFDDAGVGVEIMATPSACRTHNVLLAEGRRVAAALIFIPPSG